MSIIKKIFGWLIVTLVIWTISRFVPGLVTAIYPESFFIRACASLLLLPAGYFFAIAITKRKYVGCAQINVSIFALIEVLGIIETLFYIFENLSFYDSRYSYDVNGIAYSNYFAVFGTAILFEMIYIGACIYLIMRKDAPKKEVTLQEKPILVEKNHEEKQKLRDEIAKLKNTLREMDESYETNRKILSDAFSDEQLEQMIANGEFPADKVSEYITQRKNLAIFVDMYPSTRATTVKLIGDLTKKLAELECQN